MNWLLKQKMVAVLFCFLAVGSTVLVATAEVKKKTVAPVTKNPVAQSMVSFETALSKYQVKKTQNFFPALTKRELKIEEALGEETDCEFADQPLLEIMAFFSAKHAIPIIIMSNDLGEEGLTVDEPVNLHIKEVTLHDALELILQPIGLTYIVENGVVKITTTFKASEKLTSRVYPVGDLCRTVEDYVTLESALRNADLGDWRARKTGCASEKTQYQSQKSNGPSPAGGGFFNIPDGKFKGGESVAPLLYEDGDGGTITIVPHSNALVITQTYHAHKAIVDLLTQIREAGVQE
ncbi:MAG: STN domain-containing protein [Planctomycetaceae bacterium]|nr:STN domain-containing protein [Planctomycetaceae bacterium]